MNRYSTDSDNAYHTSRQQSDNVRASGWQSPIPTSIPANATSSSVTRIVVECPFGSKKCDYSIDKSQRGRLIVTARRRQTFSSDYLSSKNKNNVAIQTFTIPNDANVEHLKSHIEQNTNRLIIEIPRQSHTNYRKSHASYMNTNDANTGLIRSHNVERMLTSPVGGPRLIRDDTKYIKQNSGNHRKLEYRIDCQGYTADELDVYIQGRDLIVQGKTKRTMSPDPTQRHVSKHFTRKIALPNTVDLSKVVSYLQNGELRIDAPLKRGVVYSDEEIILPEQPPIAKSYRTTAGYNRIGSPTPGKPQHHYRHHERVTRRRAYDRGDNYRPLSPTRRIRSTEGFRYPYYRSSRDFDEDDDDEDDSKEGRHRRTVNYERHIINRNGTEEQPIYRSIYAPKNNVVTTRTTYNNYPTDEETYFKY